MGIATKTFTVKLAAVATTWALKKIVITRCVVYTVYFVYVCW